MTPPIFTPDGTEVEEVILPDGSAASEVIAPDGTVVFDVADSEVLNQADSVWWADEGSGELVSDSVSNNDGTINNVDWTTGESTGSTEDGEGGIYLNFFDGNVDFGSIYTGGDFFYCIFARPTDAGGSNFSVFGDSDPDDIFGVDLNSSGGSWRAWLNGENDDSNVNAKEDVWAMACLTFSDDTNAGRLFVYEVGSDPEQIVNISVDGDGNDVNIADFLWGEDASIDNFRGDLDFGVFGSNYLSESDVEEHWNAFKENYE